VWKLPAARWWGSAGRSRCGRRPDGSPRDLKDAGVVELTGLLRACPGTHGRPLDQLKTWPDDMRVIT